MLSIKNFRKDWITTVAGVALGVGVLVARFIPATGTTWAEVLLVEPVALGLMGVDSRKLFNPKNETTD